MYSINGSGGVNILIDNKSDTLQKVELPSTESSGSGSLGSLIKFGYKEYLMLFVYIGLCAKGDAENNKILLRTADLIQFNICHAGEKVDFSHEKAEKFRMTNARTYVHVTAKARLDMFFVDLGMFAPEKTDTESETGELLAEV